MACASKTVEDVKALLDVFQSVPDGGKELFVASVTAYARGVSDGYSIAMNPAPTGSSGDAAN